MIKAAEIFQYINDIAPFDTAMSFDNVGILIGSREAESKRVLLALDASRAVIEEAKEKQAGIVITHHPVIFNPLKRLMEQSVPYAAARYGITIISAHTNLDVARGGVNDTLAGCIGVEPEQFFDEDCALLGIIDTEMTARGFAERIRDRMKLRGLRYTDCDHGIRKVMVSCGAGGSNIFLAAELGADAFVTGEIKHHEIVFANDNGIAVFDLGHFQSEDAVIPLLAQKLAGRFPETEFIVSENDNDGVSYLAQAKQH